MTKPKIQLTNKFQIPNAENPNKGLTVICYLNIEIYE